MSERDELAVAIGNGLIDLAQSDEYVSYGTSDRLATIEVDDFDLDKLADLILAAGWRKPRAIETAKDLFHSGLTEGSILLSVGDHYKGVLWVVAGGMIARVGKERDGVCPPLLFKDPLPVTVLHEGGAS